LHSPAEPCTDPKLNSSGTPAHLGRIAIEIAAPNLGPCAGGDDLPAFEERAQSPWRLVVAPEKMPPAPQFAAGLARIIRILCIDLCRVRAAALPNFAAAKVNSLLRL